MSEGRCGGRPTYVPPPPDWPTTRDEVRAARLAEKRGDDRSHTPRFEGRAAADPGPSLRVIVGGYLAEWRTRRAGVAVLMTGDEPEEDEP